MGSIMINNRKVETPRDEIRVDELKELAGLPPHEKPYTQDGRILDDHEVVPANNARLGSVTDWERGGV